MVLFLLPCIIFANQFKIYINDVSSPEHQTSLIKANIISHPFLAVVEHFLYFLSYICLNPANVLSLSSSINGARVSIQISYTLSVSFKNHLYNSVPNRCAHAVLKESCVSSLFSPLVLNSTIPLLRGKKYC